MCLQAAVPPSFLLRAIFDPRACDSVCKYQHVALAIASLWTVPRPPCPMPPRGPIRLAAVVSCPRYLRGAPARVRCLLRVHLPPAIGSVDCS